VGIWGSNVDDSISKGNIEIDFYGGYRFALELYYSDSDNAAFLGKSIADERVVFQISRTF
jgi:hypothetical protein